MCDPVTASIVLAAGAQVGGTVANYQSEQDRAKVLAAQAGFQQQRASSIVASSATAESQTRGQALQMAAAQQSTAAASGVDVASGSVGEVLEDTARTAAADIGQQRYNAKLRAWEAKTSAWYLKHQSKKIKRQSETNLIIDLLGIGGGLAARGASSAGGSSTLKS